MTKRASLVAGLLLVLWGGDSHALTCPEGQIVELYEVDNGNVHSCGSLADCVTSVASVGDACIALAGGAGAACFSSTGAYQDASDRWRCGFAYNTNSCAFPLDRSGSLLWHERCIESEPEPEECEIGSYSGALTAAQRTTYAYPNDVGVCVDGCVADRTFLNGIDAPGLGDNLTGAVWQVTGGSCGGGGSGEMPTPFGPDCESVNGHTVCRSENVNCMVVDGEEICGSGAGGVCVGNECLDDGELFEYLQTDNGAVITDANAPTPPKPDDGTPNNPATPDLPIRTGTGERETGSGEGSRDFHYYGPETVGKSSDPPGTCDPQIEQCGGEYGGDCDPETEECGASITGGQNCKDKPVCEGDPVECFIAHKEWQIWCSTQIPKNSDLDAAIAEGLTDDGQTLEQYLEGQTFNAGEWFELPAANACTVEDITLDIPFLGQTVVPLSMFCPLFSTIGLFVLAGAALKSLHIVLQGLG